MISYRSDREILDGTAFVRVNRRRAPAAYALTLTRRRAVDFCRVAAAL